MQPKHIDISEFRQLGYLQEANRLFFHPLGLALEVSIDDNGVEIISGIWDYRDDPVGIIYDLKNSDKSRITSFQQKEAYVNAHREALEHARIEKLGFTIEPIM